MTTQIKMDFYQVVLPDGTSSPFETILQQVDGSAKDATRNVDVRGAPIRLQHASHNKGHWEGEMLRIRMSSLPVKAKLTGSVSQLNFDADEGIGEETAFLYHPAWQVLLLQRNQYGVAASSLARYFEDRANLPEPIVLAPILGSDAVARLGQMTSFRTLSLRVAPLGNPDTLKTQGHGLGGMIDLLKEVDAPQVTVSLEMGRQRGSLSVKGVVRMASDLLRRSVGDGIIEKIEISGRTEEEAEMQVFDLLQLRMQEVENVAPNRDRRIAYPTRRQVLRMAWERRREELRRMYGN
jgi:hypothetical protein